ncbi:vigilin-like [Daphnia carinata]|uniref:vigilin-like n=1 Tax=Daphnia carinata TaxID=120202 RepID=UPI002579587C|nr:vigilin-like [Daphnia carinata]XP_059351914.1 vigilin-like [Daphnia carinata]
MDTTIPSTLHDISPDPKSHSDGNGLGNPSVPPSAMTYDDIFPGLPETAIGVRTDCTIGKWNNKLRVSSRNVTQVFHIPPEERRVDSSNKFGEGDLLKTCADIMQSTGATIETSYAKDQSLTFVVIGKQDSVLEAKREILKRFQTQSSSAVEIPKEYHGFILGKGGVKLKELEKQTATKITIPKETESSGRIVVTGPKEGIEKALHEIQMISDERSKQAYERLEIPKIYHPFITGAHNETIKSLTEGSGVKVNIPPLSVQKDEISIAGERDGVLKVKHAIIQIYEEMKRKCATVSVEVRKSQHKYVIGPKGAGIAEILAESGVSVEMPPTDSDKETITLRGPQEKLGIALTKVYEKANSVCTAEILAPSWIHRHIIGKKGAGIRAITQDYPKVHVEMEDKADKIIVEGPVEEVERVRVALQANVEDLLSKLTFADIVVDPKYHKHIIGKGGSNVNRLKEETGVTINIPDERSSTIRIEGTPNGVNQAKAELMEMVTKMENEREKDILIEHRFHKNIIGAKGEKIREIRDMFHQVQVTFPDSSEKSDVVKIRGPKQDVDATYKYLQKLYKELLESSYSVKVPIYKEFHKNVIGKGGANIRKIREETSTRIDLPPEGSDSDMIVITGRKEDVEKARDRILKIQSELVSIIAEDVEIPAKYHQSFIGAGGKLIQSIMEDCGGVQIKFPPSESGSNKVLIRGPKEEVEKAKKTLIEMSNEKNLTGYTETIRSKPEHHRFLIGRNGSNIRKIRELTGARIVFPSDSEANNTKERDIITIVGREDAVKKAREELENRIKELDSVVELEMHVEPKYHRHFVARRGEILHEISDQYGGVTVSFPRSGVDSDRVVLKGAKECVEAARHRIEEIVNDLEQQVTIDCVIPQKFHRTIMGSKGTRVQNITTEFDVKIKFPEKSPVDTELDHVNGQQPEGESAIDDAPKACDVIRITGRQDRCEAAKNALIALVPITVEVSVPYDLHRYIIGQKGKDVREMMTTHDVNIKIPSAEQQSEAIQISGPAAKVEAARQALLDRVTELEKEREDRVLRNFAVHVEVPPEYHSKIIGKKGAVISKLRDDFQVNITMPKPEDPNPQLITIKGYEENANQAKEAVLKMVQDLDDLIKQDLPIDQRVHSRLIGRRGRNIRQVMDQYKVEIRFPFEGGDPDIVTIIGREEKVQECADYLLNLVEEYMQDIDDNDSSQQYLRAPKQEGQYNQRNPGQPGFIVAGAPWEQQAPPHQGQQRVPVVAPNTASNEEFPSFGKAGPNTPSGGAPHWGPRR